MFGVSKPVDVDENLTDLPELENEDSERYILAYVYYWWLFVPIIVHNMFILGYVCLFNILTISNLTLLTWQ